MSDPTSSYRELGWTVFPPEDATRQWALACAPLAEKLSADPAHDHWWRCARTWFAGANILPNDERAAVPDEGVPPLAGAAVDFITNTLGIRELAFDTAQISIVTPGYPAHGDEETEAAHRYRVKRCAAHVDGLELIMPSRRRRFSETHGFILGIPLNDASVEQSAFVVWEGSHDIMRDAFRRSLEGADPADWNTLDITHVYTAARKRVFETCKAVELAPGLGGCTLVHPLALHGVAPWRAGDAPSRAVAYFRPDTCGGDVVRWLDQ